MFFTLSQSATTLSFYSKFLNRKLNWFLNIEWRSIPRLKSEPIVFLDFGLPILHEILMILEIKKKTFFLLWNFCFLWIEQRFSKHLILQKHQDLQTTSCHTNDKKANLYLFFQFFRPLFVTFEVWALPAFQHGANHICDFMDFLEILVQ